MIRALIIDDEYLAREELAQLLARTKRFQLVGCCGNALEAIKMIQRENPEVLFLDIEMPVVDGFELLGMIDQEWMPQVVFVTAYDQHALRAFEEKTLDYLVKPVDPDRLQKTLAKLDKALSRGTQPNYPIPPEPHPLPGRQPGQADPSRGDSLRRIQSERDPLRDGRRQLFHRADPQGPGTEDSAGALSETASGQSGKSRRTHRPGKRPG